MTNRVVTLTLKQLDITQLSKVRGQIDVRGLGHGSCYRDAYMLELVTLIDAMIAAGYASKDATIKAPPMTL